MWLPAWDQFVAFGDLQHGLVACPLVVSPCELLQPLGELCHTCLALAALGTPSTTWPTAIAQELAAFVLLQPLRDSQHFSFTIILCAPEMNRVGKKHSIEAVKLQDHWRGLQV